MYIYSISITWSCGHVIYIISHTSHHFTETKSHTRLLIQKDMLRSLIPLSRSLFETIQQHPLASLGSLGCLMCAHLNLVMWHGIGHIAKVYTDRQTCFDPLVPGRCGWDSNAWFVNAYYRLTAWPLHVKLHHEICTWYWYRTLLKTSQN